VKSRELISKLFFADLATRQGYGVFVGRNGMNISRDHFPRGVYFDKSQMAHQLKSHKYQVEHLGNKLVSLDEEALIVNETHAKTRFTQSSIDLSSAVFAWGEREAQMINERYVTEGKVHVSGSPRVDCWRPGCEYLFSSEISSIKERFGDFILINSNFGASVLPRNRYTEDELAYLERQGSIRAEFLKLIEEVAKAFPQRRVVLRPHPGEEPTLWESIKSELPENAHIILEGSVSPWIRAASVLLHHCCTTAVEAWIGGTPSISFEPPLAKYPDYRPFHELPSILSARLTTPHQVIEAIKKGFDQNASMRVQHTAALRAFLGFDEAELSSHKILREINALDLEEDGYEIPNFTFWKKFRHRIYRTRYRLTDIFDANRIPLRYHLQKNPGMALSEIIDFTGRMDSEDPNRASNLQIHQVDVDTFCLYRDEISSAHA
jgi:surface carbohydrate biosynthesis protein